MTQRVFRFGALVGVAAAVLGFGAAVSAAWAQAPFDPPGLERAMAAKDFHVNRLLGTGGVVGVGVGLTAGGQAAVVIATDGPGVRGLPRRLDGVPVVIKVTGAFHAINKPDANGNHDHGDDNTTDTNIDPTSRFDRPVPIGVSTGNGTSCSAGTIGFRVTDGTDVYAMSNNHVYALSGNAVIGDEPDPVVQPGRYDSNCAEVTTNNIGTLHSYVPIEYESCSNGGTNYVDVAIAASTTAQLGYATPIDGYGAPSSSLYAAALLGLDVQKYGRTTGLTKGTVTVINYTGNIGYSQGTACFRDQIIVESRKGAFIKAGDSGSGLVTDDANANPVGLLYAGNRSGKVAVANHIDDVLDALNSVVEGVPVDVTVDDGT